MFLLRRRIDGTFRKKSRPCGVKWTVNLEDAQVFKTISGCKQAVMGSLYERVQTGTFIESWDKQELPSYKYVKHPEWFEEKFEVVPVTITRIIEE